MVLVQVVQVLSSTKMATLLQTDASGLNQLAMNADTIYPIAARCGVFAKTDVQALLNQGRIS